MTELEKAKLDLSKKLGHMPISMATQKSKKRKEEWEDLLKGVEEGLIKFSDKRTIYVEDNDEEPF